MLNKLYYVYNKKSNNNLKYFLFSYDCYWMQCKKYNMLIDYK